MLPHLYHTIWYNKFMLHAILQFDYLLQNVTETSIYLRVETLSDYVFVFLYNSLIEARLCVPLLSL